MKTTLFLLLILMTSVLSHVFAQFCTCPTITHCITNGEGFPAGEDIVVCVCYSGCSTDACCPCASCSGPCEYVNTCTPDIPPRNTYCLTLPVGAGELYDVQAQQ